MVNYGLIGGNRSTHIWLSTLDVSTLSFTMSKIKITLQPSHLERAHSDLIRLKLKSLDTK